MSGPLSRLTFPTVPELLAAGWSAWWKKSKLPPSPQQLLDYTDGAFCDWRDTRLEAHADHLTALLGERLLPLLNIVADLAETHLDVRGWEFPDADDDPECVIPWIAWVLACLRWQLVYETRDQPAATYQDASAFLLHPPPRPALTPPDPKPKPNPPGQLALF